jgi:hypothetical protein
MLREAFDTRKRFLGFPEVSCAGWVGTIKHSTMTDGVERAEPRQLCCVMSSIVKVTKNMEHTKQKHTRHIHLGF